MAQTINPYNAIVNGTNNYQANYQATAWKLIQNNQDGYWKGRIAKTETIENDVVKIESTVSVGYSKDYQAYDQSIIAINVIRITPKQDITDRTIRISSFYSQETLPYDNGSNLKYYRADGTTTTNFYTTQFLNMTEYNQQVIANFLDTTHGITTQQNLKETWTASDYGEDIISIFANPEEIQFNGSPTTPMIFVYLLNYYQEYDPTVYPEGNWNNNANYLYNQPSVLTGTYSWTVNTDTINNIEVIDIPGLLFTILGMPFAFISQAFNLTIFPGTAYELNLTHIFLALIVSGIIIFIIKKVLK